MRNARSSIDS